jgi:hypothetical protein
VSLHDILYLATGGVIGVGASVIVAGLPEWLRTVRARNVSRERLFDEN